MSSIFDILGPVMVGPSSSHTAGAVRIGYTARQLFGEPVKKAIVYLHGSFAATGEGHGTDKALVAGLLGFSADDTRLRDSFSIAAEKGLEITLQRSDEEVDHPNTVRIAMTGKNGNQAEILGVSLGGGKIEIREINGFEVSLNGEEHTLITLHRDQPGIIAQATTIMAIGHINVSTMKVFRSGKHANAVMIVCTDSPVPAEMVSLIGNISAIESVITLAPL